MHNLQQYWVYILSNKTRDVLYVGVTNDLRIRYYEHRDGVNEGFTKKYNCHCILYYEESRSVEEAIAREKQLKGWSHAKKMALIRTINPWLYDFAEQWGWKDK